MSDGCVDANNKIQIHNKGRRIGKIVTIFHPINQMKNVGGSRSFFLKGEELNVWHIHQRSQNLWCNGSFLVRRDKFGRVGA